MDCWCRIGAGSGIGANGISAFSARDHFIAGSDLSGWAQDRISAAGLQRMAEGFLCYLATIAEAGTCRVAPGRRGFSDGPLTDAVSLSLTKNQSLRCAQEQNRSTKG